MKKKTNSKNFVIFLLMILIIALVGAGIFSFVKYSKFGNNSKKVLILDVNSEEVKNLFLLTRPEMTKALFVFTDYEDIYYKQDRLIINDLGEDFKMALAYSRLDYTAINYKGDKISFKESDLKKSYQEVFGDLSNYQDQDFGYGCPKEIVYNEENDLYEYEHSCTFILTGGYENKLVEAKRYNDRVEIYEKVVFFEYDDESKEVIYYRDYEHNSPFEQNKYDFNAEGISTYKYTFKKNSDGKYYFYSVEKQK